MEKVANVVNSLEEDAQSISQCKTVLQDPSLQNNLKFVEEHFGDIPKNIKYFETQTLKLEEAITTLIAILTKMKNIPGNFGASLSKKIDAVFARNPDFVILKNLYSENNECDAKYRIHKSYFQYAPITSCDVERSFSIFKDILTNTRTSLTAENLNYILTINVNKSCLT